MSIEDDVRSFRPGLYRHYKGNVYSAYMLLTHHENRMPMVFYTSLTYGAPTVRPLRGWEGDPDGWLDEVYVDVTKKVPRFAYVGELPSDVKAVDRILP